MNNRIGKALGAPKSMSINSISFWQQDRNFWARSQKQDQSQAQSNALINVIGNAMTTLSQGLSSLANQTALTRVNTQLSAAVQNALNPGSANTTSSVSATSSTSSASSGAAPPSVVSASPATGTGTVPLTAGTSLFALGILPKGTVSVSDGTFTTTYRSTGSDTVADLISAINANVAGNANVAAWLDGSGKLVVTGKNDFNTVTVAGSYAANVGFGTGNNVFLPTKQSSTSANAAGSSGAATNSNVSASSSSSSSKSSTGSSGNASSAQSASAGITRNSALALQTGGTAEILLASSGLAGNILNMLA